MIDTIFKVISGVVRIRGKDGLVADVDLVDGKNKLQTTTSITSLPTTTISAWSPKLRYVDMNASSGGVARNTSITTTFVTIFSYSGTGYLAGVLLNVETNTKWKFKIIVDGQELFTSGGMLADDITGDTVYDLDDPTEANFALLGISKGQHDRFVFISPLGIPIRYNASVVVQVARTDATTKRFQAGLVILSKET